jgi:hypothetical protein
LAVRINKYGLSRRIPADIKYLVRKNCNFGCVICGMVPYEYDHLRVPFYECREHDPDDIVLLCTKHHDQKTRGFVNFEDIYRYRKLGTAKDSLSRFKIEKLRSDFFVKFGSSEFHSTPSSFIVDDEKLIDVLTTDNPLEPVVVNGKIYSFNGKPILEIYDNEIINIVENIFDFEVISNRFLYKSKIGTNLEFDVNSNRMNISKIFHTRRDAFIRLKNDDIFAGNLRSTQKITRIMAQNCLAGVVVGSTVENFDFSQFDIEQLPYNCVSRMSVNYCGAAIVIEGQKRPIITSNYNRF